MRTRQGKHNLSFLLGVCVLGLACGLVIHLVLPSPSSEAAFFAIVGVSVALVVFLRALLAASAHAVEKYGTSRIPGVPTLHLHHRRTYGGERPAPAKPPATPAADQKESS